jgi:hypothetical protein
MVCGYAKLDVQPRYDASNPWRKRLVANGTPLHPSGKR